MTRDEARALDAADPLRRYRDLFDLPEGVIYLDGNSLGPLPRASASAMEDMVSRQWGEGLIRSWNEADWINAPARIGGKIAPLIGADPDEVIVTDSTSANLFKGIVAALRTAGWNGQWRVEILSEEHRHRDLADSLPDVYASTVDILARALC